MHNTIIKLIAFTFAVCLLSSPVVAAPLLTITPNDYTYHDSTVALGSVLTIPYTVTNNTPVTLSNITASHLPAGITATTCTSIAANGGSCTLTLTVPASMTQQPDVIRGQFQVCVQNPATGCTQVDNANQLNITVTNNQTFLAITDIHLKDGKATPITYGQDTGDSLWASTQTEITNLIAEQNPKFIVLLGDLPAHHDMPNLQTNIGAVLTGLSNLPAISDNNLPVFYVFGNNDSLVDDYGVFYDGSVNLFSLDPAHNSPATKGWPALNTNPDCSVSPMSACTYTTTAPMPAEHADDMAFAQTRGYYSAYPLGSATPLRFISINSVIFSHEYALTGAAQLSAAQEEFDWLSAQLAAANVNGESVYLAMHIPVGDDAFNHGDDMWNDTLLLNNGLTFRNAFLALVAQYKTNIRAVMTAHTHLDELRALYADSAFTNLSVLDVGLPGITPQHYNNPGMQIYLYDNTYNLTDAKTFYTTPVPGIWQTYSYQHDYGCAAGSTMFSCLSTNILPNIPAWLAAPQPIAGNPYELDYSVRVPTYDPSNGGYSSWLAILNSIRVITTV